MSKAQLSPTAASRLRRAPCSRLLAIIAPALSILEAGGGASAAALGKSYFFATREACAASGAFTPRECDRAFANARAQLRDHAPRFQTSADCRLKFRLCEMRRSGPQDDEETASAEQGGDAFSPLALGVEMVASLRGVEAAPVLAVETPPSLFPRFPVSRVYEAEEREPPQQEAFGQSAILPADRFEPFARRKPVNGAASFSAYTLGALDDSSQDDGSQETPEQRRARLRSAPFIE